MVSDERQTQGVMGDDSACPSLAVLPHMKLTGKFLKGQWVKGGMKSGKARAACHLGDSEVR